MATPTEQGDYFHTTTVSPWPWMWWLRDFVGECFWWEMLMLFIYEYDGSLWVQYHGSIIKRFHVPVHVLYFRMTTQYMSPASYQTSGPYHGQGHASYQSGYSPPSQSSVMNGKNFAFRKRFERVDWRKLASLDIDTIARTLNFTALQENIMNITFCNIEGELVSFQTYSSQHIHNHYSTWHTYNTSFQLNINSR